MAIKDLRLRKKLTQEELAYKSKVSVRTISRVENKIKQTQIGTLIKISKGLDCEIGEIFEEIKKEIE